MDPSPRQMEIKPKINKCDLINLKAFAHQRKTHTHTHTHTHKTNLKRQPTEWEKVFVNDVTEKGLISKIYKQPIQLHIKKPHAA